MITATPAPRANQNTSFSPALKRPDGACFDLMKPPPCLTQSMSTFCGMLSLIQSATMRASPTTNEALTKLCVVFGGRRPAAEPCWPDYWQQYDFTECDIQSGQAEHHERHRGQPMREAL